MYITGSHYRLVELFSQRYDPAVDVLNILDRIHIPDTLRSDHELVVATGLNLQVIIEFYQSGDLRIRLSVQQGTIQLSRLTGASQDQTLSVFQDQALGNPGMLVKIGQM